MAGSSGGPIDAIREELARLEVALHRKPLTAARVVEHRRRIERIHEQLVRVDLLVRQTCSHDGTLDANGVCLACGLPVDQASRSHDSPGQQLR